MKLTTKTIALGLGLALALGSCNQVTTPEQTKSFKALPASTEFDLVILNGRVMDPETEFDGIRNVGIKDGIIGLITEAEITGKETIDASGHVVSPGFIDTHFHSVDGLGMKIAAGDGLTTAIDLEAGAWNIDEWYAEKKDKWPLNYGTSVSHEVIRKIVLDSMTFDGPSDALTLFTDRAAAAGKDGVLGWSVIRPNNEQLNRIIRMADEGLRLGALGASSLTGYAPQGITTYELYEVQRAAAKYGRMYASHQRTHGNTQHPEAALGFDEMYANAMAFNSPLMVCHNNDWGWWEIEEKLQKGRDLGHNMWSEYYPYTAISTNAEAQYLQPAVWEENMHHVYEGNFYDPTADKTLSKDEFLKMTKDDPGHTLVVTNPDRVPWLPYWLRMPHMTVASDAMWMDNGHDVDFPLEKYEGHPRTSGSRGMVLRLARENGVPLMFTLSQLSYWSAKHLGDMGLVEMQKRGRMQEGMVADITIFDPQNAREGSTYKSGEQGLPSKGIPYVIVNGTMVVNNSEFQKNTFPGQILRFPVESKGRFEEITAAKWIKDFSVDIPTVEQGAVDEKASASFKKQDGSN